MKNTIRNVIAAGVLAAGMPLLYSCGSILANYEYRKVPDLVVNTDNSYRTVAEKSEEEGVRDIRRLAETSNLEEAWVFLPDKSKWIEVGRGEKAWTKRGMHSSRCCIYPWELEKIFSENERVVIYHPHPEIDTTCMLMSNIGYMIYILDNTMPATDDIIRGIEASVLLHKKQPKGTFSFKICSEYGVTEFRLTEKGMKEFSESGYCEMENFAKGLRCGSKISEKVKKEPPSFSDEEEREFLSHKRDPKYLASVFARSLTYLSDGRAVFEFTPHLGFYEKQALFPYTQGYSPSELYEFYTRVKENRFPVVKPGKVIIPTPAKLRNFQLEKPSKAGESEK